MKRFAIVLMLVPAALAAQTDSAPTAAELIASAVAHLKAQQDEVTHYAYTSDGKTENSSWKGLTHGGLVTTTHIESVALNGQSYVRAMTTNGHRATKAELEAFRAQMKSNVTAKSTKQQAGLMLADGRIEDLLTPDYIKRIVGHELVEGHDCILLEALPTGPITNAFAHQQVRFWIDPVTHGVLRIRKQAVADYELETGSGLTTLAGAAKTTTYRMFGGVLLPYEATSDDLMRSIEGWKGKVHSDESYSNYQRFTVTMTIKPEPASVPH